MDKLRALLAFVAIVERGSLTAAAEALDSSLPAMVRTLAALESQLGVRLLNRTTRRLSLTEEGRQYLERARRILAEVDELIAGILEEIDLTSSLLVTTSDHGNLEDAAVKGHTLNPVPTILSGWGRAQLASLIQSLTDLTPTLANFILDQARIAR